jgi:lysophospholipase L1-like esterase
LHATKERHNRPPASLSSRVAQLRILALAPDMIRRVRLIFAGLAVFVAGLVPLTAAPERWAAEIDQLTAADAGQVPAKDAVVFVGSSSIRMWKSLAQDFPGIKAINRGFGGSELADSVHYAARLVIPWHPRAVVLYAGDNDLWAGKSPETVAADFAAFHATVRSALPGARLIFLSIKPSPARARVWPAAQRANALIAAACATDPLCRFVDVGSTLLDAAGRPRPELYLTDQLHLSPAGYALWTKVLAPHLQP